MRYTLTDYARKRKLKLVSLDAPLLNDDGGGTTNEAVLEGWSESNVDDLLTVDEALNALERSDARYGGRRSKAVQLNLFGGMNYREIAEELGVTEDMARRDCQIALTYLKGFLGGPSPDGPSLLT